MANTNIYQSYLVTIVIVIAFVNNISCNKKSKYKPKLDENGCTVNQTYVNCKFDCPTDSCLKDDGPQPVCDPPPAEYCKPGCRCKLNYKKDKNGNCILACDCPKIKCTGFNEVYNCCPSACLNEQCKARNDPPVTCNTLLLNCQPKCVCRPGTWRNSKNVCVEASDCDELDEYGCTVNQTYVNCNFDCPTDWCLKDDGPQPVCDAPRPEDCKPGCRCKINYRKDKNGKCILACDCPPIKCTGNNEVYECCPSECLNEQCEARNDPPVTCNTLLLNCQPKCICREGFWRNSNNECVKPRYCDDKPDCKE